MSHLFPLNYDKAKHYHQAFEMALVSNRLIFARVGSKV